MQLYNILIVDDALPNLNALERTLRSEYNVFSATNGEDALAIMEQNDIALIIADHRMTGMTGLELLEKILQKHPDTIRMILTAYSDEELLMGALNVRVHKYMDKPWSPETMRATVRRCIEAYESMHAKMLIKDKPYERFSSSPVTGFAPGVTVRLHMPASGRKIPGKRALIDTGSEITWIYPRDVEIDPLSDVDYNPETGELLVGVEISGRLYYVQCGYQDHPYAGTEEMLIGMDLLSNWLVELNGRRRLLSVTHLEPDE